MYAGIPQDATLPGEGTRHPRVKRLRQVAGIKNTKPEGFVFFKPDMPTQSELIKVIKSV